MRFFAVLVLLMISTVFAPKAHAKVVATFYSHEFGDHFPHSFITLVGTVDATGEQVDSNFGFTAVHTSPAILWGSVTGMVETKDAKYIAKSTPHFKVTLSDADYGKMITLIETWRNLPGKSYNLDKRNCIHFTMEAAKQLGLSINPKSKFFKKPKSFMVELMALNPQLSL